MRVTTKGQVTIPQHIREKLGITPSAEVDFIEEKGRIILVKRMRKKQPYGILQNSVVWQPSK
jgi:AbrB family looped-hinge helix DNA binding protein